MAIDYDALKAELDAGHPDEGTYSAVDATAVAQLNATGAYTSWARPANATADELFSYLVANRSKLSAEPHATPLIGRLKEVAETAIAANTSWGETVQKEHKHAASLFYLMAVRDPSASINFVSAELDDSYTLMGPPSGSIGTGGDERNGIGVWKAPDETAIRNLSEGKQSRAQEIAAVINYNGEITESHVQHARSQP